jgi:tetrahydromethanopterin S-methyltransferase subunit E
MDAREQREWHVVKRRLLTPGGVGVSVAVANGATSHAVTFARTEADASYAVLVEPSWLTTHRVTSKATTGFTVSFGTAAGAADTIDYAVLRKED